MPQEMPRIDLTRLDGEALEYAKAITNQRTGRLRATKPKMRYKIKINKYGWKVREYLPEDTKKAYVWRMVAFLTSPRPQHQCMPIGAILDLAPTTEEARKLEKELDPIVDEIVNAVPMKNWHGVIRWGRALGKLR